MTQGEVRALQAGLMRVEQSSDEEDVARRRLSVVGYLYMLAEQIKAGQVTGFEVVWDGADAMDAQIVLEKPAEYIKFSFAECSIAPDE